jgi:hypothetical protein
VTANGCTTVTPDGIFCSSGLNNFSAAATGTFSAAIPEPATWGLMIMGFGGMGAVLRNRRRQGLAFAA